LIYKLSIGLFLVLAGWLLHWSYSGLVILYSPPLPLVGPGEFNLWLTYFTLWLPASLVLARLVPAEFADRTISYFGRKKEWLAVAISAVLLTLFYRFGRYFFLRDLPVTDEEYTNQFGGRVLASGKWAVDLDIPIDQMPTLFLINGTDGWTSFDFLGIQIVWAISEITRTGPWIFAVLAAGTAVGMYVLVRDMLGAKWAVVATVIYLFSPMATLLSFTTHAHVVSRFFIVWFLVLWFRGDSNPQNRTWWLCGLCWGASMTCRPAETLMLTAPFLLYSSFQLVKRQTTVQAAGMFLLGVVPFALLYFVHNYGVTGQYWLPPRMAPNDLTTPQGNVGAIAALSDWEVLRRRIIENIVNNVRFTFLYWHGGLGAVLVFFGVVRKKPEMLLVAALMLHALMGLLHDNDGVRVVGPIHFSEWVVYLTVLATLGLKRLKSFERDFNKEMLVALAICGVLVTGVVGFSLRVSNSWHAMFFDFVDQNIPANAIVMAPRNGYFWRTLPLGTHNGSWVFESRSPLPDLSDDILILRYTSGAETSMRRQFPNRDLFILTPHTEPPYIQVERIE